ncbi:MAG: LytTR family DNA-binding domain-containing protein [Erysipelotrichaceae bacterium]|nr:LytTR family DNA-binding domain-containing protein [Erysipelotrichaceae bacterium]
MFKIKFPLREREIIKQTLGISESLVYEIVLCSNIADWEADKINIVFDLDKIDDIKDKIQFFTKVNSMQLYGRTPRGEVKTEVSDIYYIESFGNEVIAYTQQREISLMSRLYAIIDQLEPFGFVRIGKSIIVNITKIDAVDSSFNGKLSLTLTNGKVLEVNRSYTKAFKEYLKGR